MPLKADQPNSRSLSSTSLLGPRSVSIVLPCHNESAALESVLDRLFQSASQWASSNLRLAEVLIVDDGSTDGSLEIARAWSLSSPHPLRSSVRILAHGARRGYGAALKTGISASSGDYIAFYDVDGTYDPEQIPKMVDQMVSQRAEMACGDRLSRCQHMPLTREIGNRLFVGTINILYRTKVFDSCTGMRIFTKDLREFFASHALPDGLDYSLAMTLTFLRTGHRLIELPIPYARRLGRSKLRVMSDGPRFFLRILASWLHTPQNVKVFRHSRRTD